MTLGGLIRQTAHRLRAARLHYGHGTDNPRDEAAFLVLRALGLPFDANLRQVTSASQRKRVAALVERRIRERIPTAYLLHEAWLAGVPFYIDARAIIPRPFISELLPERLRPWLPRRVPRVLDLCTGSGCIAVLLARAFPRAHVDATDISLNALEVAKRNVRRHRLGRRIQLMRSHLFASLRNRRYDLIVSNPPYVPAATMEGLPREYRHEPRRALAGGRDGLAFVRRILAQAHSRLTPGGLLVCEIGDNRPALERAYPRTPFLWPETSAGPGQVFMLAREWLPAPARTAAASRTLPRPARARR